MRSIRNQDSRQIPRAAAGDLHLSPEALAALDALPAEGMPGYFAPTTFVDGLENAPDALMQILRPNATLGKVLVRVS